MTKRAAQLRIVDEAASSAEARVIDIRTGKAWRPAAPEPKPRSFLLDVGITFALVLLGAWLFVKMQGG